VTNLLRDFEVPIEGIGFVQVRASGLGFGIEGVPRLIFRHFRDAFGRIFGRHRRDWLAHTKVRFEKLNAEAPNSRPAELQGIRRSQRFFYKVQPAEKRVPEGQSAERAMKDLGGESYTESPVAQGIETGGEFRSRSTRFMAIPIGFALNSKGDPKPRWASPSSFHKASPNGKLIALVLNPSKLSRLPKLYLALGVRSKRGDNVAGAVTQLNQGGRTRRKLVPMYQLVPAIKRRALLRYFGTWEEQEADRDQVFAEARARIVSDFFDGKTS